MCTCMRSQGRTFSAVSITCLCVKARRQDEYCIDTVGSNEVWAHNHGAKFVGRAVESRKPDEQPAAVHSHRLVRLLLLPSAQRDDPTAGHASRDSLDSHCDPGSTMTLEPQQSEEESERSGSPRSTARLGV